MRVGRNRFELVGGKTWQPDLAVYAIGTRLTNRDQYVPGRVGERNVEVARYVTIVQQELVDRTRERIVYERSDRPVANVHPTGIMLSQLTGRFPQYHARRAAGKRRTTGKQRVRGAS